MGGQAQKLRLLQCCASGTDKIDRSALPAGTVLCNTYHHETSIAEHVLMVMLALSRDLLGADRDLRRGHWRSAVHDTDFTPHRLLAGKTVGIVGYGHIGRSIALLAKAFSMRVIALRRDPSRCLVPAFGGAD
jgi:phosphoglycerate dehydrogenase-like enzyme